MSEKVKAKEVAEQLRRLIAGEVEISCIEGRTWDGCGDVEFQIGDWRITFFNDCGELDYADSAVAPDGREGGTDEWASENEGCWNNPIDYERVDYNRLEEILRAAK